MLAIRSQNHHHATSDKGANAHDAAGGKKLGDIAGVGDGAGCWLCGAVVVPLAAADGCCALGVARLASVACEGGAVAGFPDYAGQGAGVVGVLAVVCVSGDFGGVGDGVLTLRW